MGVKGSGKSGNRRLVSTNSHDPVILRREHPEIRHAAPRAIGRRGPKIHDASLRYRINWALHSQFQNACYANGSDMSTVLRALIQSYIDAAGTD